MFDSYRNYISTNQANSFFEIEFFLSLFLYAYKHFFSTSQLYYTNSLTYM